MQLYRRMRLGLVGSLDYLRPKVEANITMTACLKIPNAKKEFQEWHGFVKVWLRQPVLEDK